MNQLTPSNKFLPILGLITIDGLLIALVAIFVFKVAIGSVISYSFFGVMILSHFWMHAGHGNHNHHQERTNLPNPMDPISVGNVENNNSQNRKHGCH